VSAEARAGPRRAQRTPRRPQVHKASNPRTRFFPSPSEPGRNGVPSGWGGSGAGLGARGSGFGARGSAIQHTHACLFHPCVGFRETFEQRDDRGVML
jgi:hypothetical protein